MHRAPTGSPEQVSAIGPEKPLDAKRLNAITPDEPGAETTAPGCADVAATKNPGVTVNVMDWLELALKLASPLYAALMVCVPLSKSRIPFGVAA